MTKIDTKTSKRFTFLLFFTFFLIGLFTFRDYGISIDEEFHRSSGFYWLNYILSFTTFEDLKNLVDVKINNIKGFTLQLPQEHPYYGVVFDLPLAFLEVIFKIENPQNIFYFKHFLNFLLFFVSSIFFYKILLNRFSNYYISLFGTLFFILSPRIYGSSFFNNKDIVFLSFVTIALYYCFKSFDKASYKNFILFAIFAALSTSQRILGIFLPVAFIVFFLLSFLSNKRNSEHILKIFFFFTFYFLFLIISWPLLWGDPINNFVLTFKYFSNHPLKLKMLFDGLYVDTNFIPHNYIFMWILISTPILYTILFIFGYIQILKRFFLRFLNIKDNNFYYDLWRGVNEKKDLFILFCITSIISYLIFFNVIIYTGWRQIYFVNIFIIYIATFYFYQIKIYLKSKDKKNIQYFTTIIFLSFVVYKMIIYHPYQNIYFNSFFNKNAHEKFEVDYWGLAGKKFLDETLSANNNNEIIKIAVASFLPLERSIKLINKEDRGKIKIIGQDFQNADYIFTNFVSEVDKNFNDKYKIPDNFSKINEFILDKVIVYQVFKKRN